ncbi:glycosyltransferase family 4 protein [Halosimplex pelagicum]|uniref:Glycosyltransferase family 4 protein n=1 Tax=Halosimplex pelagicum TaxID=869886 RepID=A0A7D5P5J5_9EURY|nr:glycosyltransferase family 4 protein [Halosimplex pelagicum]QLH81343.1 glycosyltransferase family 4 protein [Halosimplex pelagicum]
MLSEDFYPKTSGGAFTDTAVASTVAKEGNKVTVLTFRNGNTSREEQHQGATIRRPVRPLFYDHEINSIPNIVGRIIATVGLLLATLSYLWNEDVDVIYSTNHFFHPVASISAALFRIPVVSFIAYTPSLNPEKKSFKNPLYIFEQINMRYFLGDVILCRNPEIAKVAKRYNSGSDVQVAHGVVNSDTVLSVSENRSSETYREWLSEEAAINADSKIITFVGRFVDIKQPEIAAGTLSELPPDYELIYIGDGDKKERVEQFVHEEGLDDRVHFFGAVPHEDVIKVLLASDSLILTSRMESYPTVVFEALSCSCSVVAPPIGILPHLEISETRLQIAEHENLNQAITKVEEGSDEVDQRMLSEYSVSSLGKQVHDSFTRLVG